MFPTGFYRDENGELNVQGIEIGALTTKYNTPLFIYDTGLMKERYEVFLNTVKNDFPMSLGHVPLNMPF